MTVQVE